jgi:hypothetical protein
MRQALFYGAVLVGTYLLVSHATGGGRLLTSGAGATATVVRAFQGR